MHITPPENYDDYIMYYFHCTLLFTNILIIFQIVFKMVPCHKPRPTYGDLHDVSFSQNYPKIESPQWDNINFVPLFQDYLIRLYPPPPTYQSTCKLFNKAYMGENYFLCNSYMYFFYSQSILFCSELRKGTPILIHVCLISYRKISCFDKSYSYTYLYTEKWTAMDFCLANIFSQFDNVNS